MKERSGRGNACYLIPCTNPKKYLWCKQCKLTFHLYSLAQPKVGIKEKYGLTLNSQAEGHAQLDSNSLWFMHTKGTCKDGTCTCTQIFVAQGNGVNVWFAPHLEDTQTSHQIVVGFDVSFQLLLVLDELLDNGFGQIAQPDEGIHLPETMSKKQSFFAWHTPHLSQRSFWIHPKKRFQMQVAHTESPACLQSPPNLVDLIFPFHDLFKVFFG